MIKCEFCRAFYHFFATSSHVKSTHVRFYLSYDHKTALKWRFWCENTKILPYKCDIVTAIIRLLRPSLHILTVNQYMHGIISLTNVLFDLILYVPSTIFSVIKGLPGLNQYLARINVLVQGHNTVTPVRLKPVAPLSRDKHSTTKPLRSNSQI